jgi:hypothetical protein
MGAIRRQDERYLFGCPVYVLHPTLQDAKRLPKWQKKSWRGIFLGFSPHHSTNVNLVLNPVTGSITPQYHVVFDEKFSTNVSTVTEDSPTSAVHLWDTLRADGYEQHQCLQDSSDDLLQPDSLLEPPDTETGQPNKYLSSCRRIAPIRFPYVG